MSAQPAKINQCETAWPIAAPFLQSSPHLPALGMALGCLGEACILSVHCVLARSSLPFHTIADWYDLASAVMGSFGGSESKSQEVLPRPFEPKSRARAHIPAILLVLVVVLSTNSFLGGCRLCLEVLLLASECVSCEHNP